MELKGKKLVLVGGAGLIGSHTVDHLIKEDVKEILIYDNMVRGSVENLVDALKDQRVKIYDVGGDILQTDILQAALEDAIDGAPLATKLVQDLLHQRRVVVVHEVDARGEVHRDCDHGAHERSQA